MTAEVISLLKGCAVIGGVSFTACFITLCCTANSLVFAYRRFVGLVPPSKAMCKRCHGTGEEDC